MRRHILLFAVLLTASANAHSAGPLGLSLPVLVPVGLGPGAVGDVALPLASGLVVGLPPLPTGALLPIVGGVVPPLVNDVVLPLVGGLVAGGLPALPGLEIVDGLAPGVVGNGVLPVVGGL